MAKSKEAQVVDVPKYTKEQLVKSVRYMNYIDFLNGNLCNDKMYTLEQVDKMIDSFYKKGGK